MRCPSLSDYDAGTHRLFWAEHIGAHAHGLYDQYEQSHERPRGATVASVMATPAFAYECAQVAAERYEAYRVKTREIEAQAHVERVRRARFEAKARAARAQQYAEQRRVAEEWQEAQRARHRAHRAQMLEEARAWARSEPYPNHVPEWGCDTLVLMHKSTDVRWNKHPIDSKITLRAGQVWRVGAQLAEARVAELTAALTEQGLLQNTATGVIWHVHDCPASFDFAECNYRCRVAREAFARAGTEPYVSQETRRDTEVYE